MKRSQRSWVLVVGVIAAVSATAGAQERSAVIPAKSVLCADSADVEKGVQIARTQGVALVAKATGGKCRALTNELRVTRIFEHGAFWTFPDPQTQLAWTYAVDDAIQVAVMGSATTTAAHGPAVNPKSPLRFEWFMVTDTTTGLSFPGPVGSEIGHATTLPEYSVRIAVRGVNPIQALEVRVANFSIWRRFRGVIAFTAVEDIEPGDTKEFTFTWGPLSEFEAREHLTSITYISKVRLATGKTIDLDPAPALRAAQQIQDALTLQDLEPRPQPNTQQRPVVPTTRS